MVGLKKLARGRTPRTIVARPAKEACANVFLEQRLVFRIPTAQRGSVLDDIFCGPTNSQAVEQG